MYRAACPEWYPEHGRGTCTDAGRVVGGKELHRVPREGTEFHGVKIRTNSNLNLIKSAWILILLASGILMTYSYC
jgi:hypothetical protein